MDLIYTDANKNDIGVLLDYNLDLAFGYDENNFECAIVAESHCCEPGSYLYIEGTEYGGIVDSIESNSSTNEVVYHGRSWHGILNSKVIEPDAGQAYLILSGEANTVIRSLITRLNLGSLFEVSAEASGLTFSNYKVPRYIEAYEGISKALNKIGGKLIVNFHNGKVHLSAVPKVDYSQSGEFDQAQTPMKVRKDYNTVNHLILLGQGELQNRLVRHLYADTEGNISQTQTQTGLDEYTAIYELSNVESASELIQQGTDHFQDLISTGDIEIDLDSDNDAFDVGDSFGSYDNITGIYVSEQITKKIISIRNGLISVDFKTEKTTSTSAASGGSSGGGGSGGAVDSVNGKTGTVVLDASDVGARADDWMPSAADVGAVSKTGLSNVVLRATSVQFTGGWTTIPDVLSADIKKYAIAVIFGYFGNSTVDYRYAFQCLIVPTSSSTAVVSFTNYTQQKGTLVFNLSSTNPMFLIYKDDGTLQTSGNAQLYQIQGILPLT